MRQLVLDTHAFLWLLEGNPKLPQAVRAAIVDTAELLHLPAIVLVELVDLISKGRSMITFQELDAALLADSRLRVAPLDQQTAALTAQLTVFADIHDRCIVAFTLLLVR